MSNPPSIPTSSKAAAPSGQLSPAQAQPGSVATGDNHGQRRSGGFGAAAAARSSPAPRNNQQSKKQHRNARRPQQSNEDAIAESVSVCIPHAPRPVLPVPQLAMRPFNSRKGQTSITHLMNFSLPPRPHHGHNSHAHARGYRRNPTWGLGSGYHAIDKARYMLLGGDQATAVASP